MKGKIIIVSAPSGAGKTTIVKALLDANLDLEFSISACSRPKRPIEKHARDYYFMSVEEFKERILNNDFLEWEEVYKNQYYGTLTSEVSRIWDKEKHIIFDVDVLGGLNIKKKYPVESLAMFIQPPSIEQLEMRLKGRSTEDEESLRKRIEKAEHEMSFANHFDCIVVNDDLQIAINKAIELTKKFLKG